MTTTLTNTDNKIINTGNTYYNSYKSFHENDSNVIINPAIITEAIENGDVSFIDRHESRKHGVNTYYKVNKLHNTVLMLVQNCQYMILSEYMYCKEEDEYINVVDSIKEFSWSLGATETSKNRKHGMAAASKELQKEGYTSTMYMHRVISSLADYGKIILLDKAWDVHHKGACYDHRQGMLMYIPHELHKHKNSHMLRMKINTYDELQGFWGKMKKDFKELQYVTEIK